MRKSSQTLFKYDSKSSLSHNSRFFGGSLLVGKRKSKRVIRPKSPYHIVLRSELARGPLSLKRFDRKIKKILSTQSQLHNVIIEDSVNVGNHIHLLIRPLSSYSYKAFIRSITGLIARGVLDAERGRAKLDSNLSQFWQYRPYSRLVHEDRKSISAIKNYFAINRCEAAGIQRSRIKNEDPFALWFLNKMKEGPPPVYS